MILAFGAPGPWELLAVLFVILLLFGAKKLPDLARSLGRSLSEFKKGKEDGERILSDPKSSEEKKLESSKESKGGESR